MTAQKVNVFLVNEQKEKQYHAKTVRGLNTKHILCHWSFHKHTHKQDVFVCLVLSDFTPLPSSSVREARYRMETQTRNQKHLPERITLHHRVKLRRSRKHTRTHARTQAHARTERECDPVTLTSDCTIISLWGGIPASFGPSLVHCSFTSQEKERAGCGTHIWLPWQPRKTNFQRERCWRMEQQLHLTGKRRRFAD